jgi:hypothetical protein
MEQKTKQHLERVIYITLLLSVIGVTGTVSYVNGEHNQNQAKIVLDQKDQISDLERKLATEKAKKCKPIRFTAAWDGNKCTIIKGK